jgi:hypothetical protein
VILQAPMRFDGERPRSHATPRLNEHGDKVRRSGWSV